MLDDVNRLGPSLILLAFAAIVLLGDLVVPRKNTLALVSLAGLAAAAAWTGVLVAGDYGGTAFSEMIVADDFTYFFSFFFAGVAALVILSSIEYAPRLGARQGEYYSLVLTAAAGMILMAASIDLISIFVALELTSVSLYILAGFLKDVRSSEASLKYLLLGAVSTAVTLYGMAFLFGLSGTTSLSGIAQTVAASDEGIRLALIVAMTFLAVGFAFKLAVVPSQMWVPDVYHGAPTPVAAYLSVGSKAAGFAMVMRVFFAALGEGTITTDWANVFAFLALVSMTVGNIIALTQTNIKRLLGYSSIAQAGYLTVGLAAVTAAGGLSVGASGTIFFLAAYAFTNLGAFIAVIAISNRINSDEIADYAGMWRRAPALAIALAFCLVSLTGIPPTVGFIAKVYIFQAAIESGLVWLVIAAVINSAISAYYYLYVVRNMFLLEPKAEGRIIPSLGLALALTIATLGTLAFGIVPSPLIDVAERAASVFAG